MNRTGIVRRVDDLGRIVIPKEIRRRLDIHENSEMELFAADEGVILKKYNPEPNLSEIAEDLMELVEENCVVFGPEKTGTIRRQIRDIQIRLKQDSSEKI